MKKILFFIVVLVLLVVILNWPVTYRVAIDGKLYYKRIPLYAKACGFLYRDWMYKDIVRTIIEGKSTDQEKALAIMEWTYKNIKRGIPAGMKATDDHPLNIIIRQYGQDDQLEDVFTILSSYAGMYGGMEKCYNPARDQNIVLSFVRDSDGRWLIFDVSKNKYFLNGEGKIASVEDHLSGDLILSNEESDEYREFLDDVANIDFSSLTRAAEQMPLSRIGVEIRKAMGGRRWRAVNPA